MTTDTATVQTYMARALDGHEKARVRSIERIEQLTPDLGLRELYTRQAHDAFEQGMRAVLRRCNIAQRLCHLFRCQLGRADVALEIMRVDELMVRVSAHSRVLTALVDDVLESRDKFAMLLVPLNVPTSVFEFIRKRTNDGIIHIFETGHETHLV